MGLLDVLGKKDEGSSIDLDLVYDRTVVDDPGAQVATRDPALAEAIRGYQAPENTRKPEIFTFEDERRRHPDNYLPCYWVATSHMDRKNYPVAVGVLQEGIRQCRVKSVLCRRLGECYMNLGDLEKAIYWFCTAVMAGERNDYHSELYLGYLCDAFGMKKASQWLRRRARGISYMNTYIAVEYTTDSIDKIMAIARERRTERAVKMLDAFYRHARKTLGYL